MVHATKFLLRWLYLNNLIYDRAEIQSLPYLHPSQVDHHYHQQQIQQHQQQQQAQQQQQQQQQYNLGGGGVSQQHNAQHQHYHNHAQHPQQQHHTSTKQIGNDHEWKRKALRKIALYPPGTSRLLALDSLRLEIVHELARKLHDADGIIQDYNRNCHLKKKRQLDGHGLDCSDDEVDYDDSDDNGTYDSTSDLDGDVSDLDVMDEDIAKDFEKATSCKIVESDDDEDDVDNVNIDQSQDKSSTLKSTTPLLSPELKEALELQRETRDFLPQFVSAILHSPPPLTTNHPDPISTLRNLLMNRCVRDPNLGIELCWLLEAEVGRTWKTLFEHRQQTGRRLILVLPADKAVVIAKIGYEKKNAFDLLNDVECATAYGAYPDDDDHDHHDIYNYPGSSSTASSSSHKIFTTPRLPASLSMKRCSHFGDTMNFIDQLTKISLRLKHIPVSGRQRVLEESLEELNRRLRRRMATEGNVSLDVEDHLGPYDWPSIADISLESLKYSVHLPVEPISTTWPGKHGPEKFRDSSPLLAIKTEHGVMKVVNIVSPKCRLLASRERCPFLVHCEVIETGLEGSDARLYANGVDKMGATVQEILGAASEKKKKGGGRDKSKSFPSYHIPSEISSMGDSIRKHEDHESSINVITDHDTVKLRGGDQEEYPHNNMPNSGYQSSTPYDVVQEEKLQQLHEHFQSNQQHPHYGPREQSVPYPSDVTPTLTTYSTLLNRVFGDPWTEACEEIRKKSPYGNVKGWRLASFIMKAGEDIRREALVMQVISKMRQFFEQDIPEQNRPYLKPYTILCVGGDAGLLECIRDAKSIDEVKKKADGFTTLRDYFERAYGPPTTGRDNIRNQPTPPAFQQGHPLSGQGQQQQPPQMQNQQHLHNQPNIHHTIHQMQHPQQYPQQHSQSQPPQHQSHQSNMDTNTKSSIHQGITFEKAQDNFLRSLVGNSLICYILQIKDRHNANILLDREGHIMHIDFGFVLGDTPKMGKVPLFSERAPFKLTAEFWDVIGGWNFSNGGLGVKFCKMFEEAFYCAAMHSEELVTLIESAILNLTQDGTVARIVANGVRERLRMRGERNSAEQKTFIMDLVNTALTSWGTSTYDWLQKSMNGYI